MSPSPFGCGLGPWRYSLSRPQRVHLCYGPVTRSLPWGDLVDRLQSFSFHHLCYPNYGALTSTPAGLSPAEHASLHWTHNRASAFPQDQMPRVRGAFRSIVDALRGLSLLIDCSLRNLRQGLISRYFLLERL